MTHLTRYLPDEYAMCLLGKLLAGASLDQKSAVTFYLNGDLGVGKTTLSRGIIQALGYRGNVKSPTYTLVETYHLPVKHVYHFDLYRLSDPEELEFMGIRDYFSENSLCLVEWSEKGNGILPPADLIIDIDYDPPGRTLRLTAKSHIGKAIIAKFSS